MTTHLERVPPAQQRQRHESVDDQGPLLELAGRLNAFGTTLQNWHKTIDSIADLRSGSKDSKELLNGQPTSRVSRYERRSAHLPHLGDNAIGINSGLEGLRSTSRTAHKTRRFSLATK